jgi:hypothetical protein
MSDTIADYSPASFRRSKSRSRSKSRHRESSGGYRRREKKEKKEKKRKRRSHESSDDDDGDKHRRRHYSDGEKQGKHRDMYNDRDRYRYRDRRDGRRDRDRSRSRDRDRHHRRHRSSPGREKEEDRSTGLRSFSKEHRDDGHEKPSKRYRKDAIPAAALGGGYRGHEYRGGSGGQRFPATGERQYPPQQMQYNAGAVDGWGNNYNYEIDAQHNDQYRDRGGGGVGNNYHSNGDRDGDGKNGSGEGGGAVAAAAAPPPLPTHVDRGPAPPSPPTAPIFQLLGHKYGLDWEACNDVGLLTALLDRATIPTAHNITRPDWVAAGEIIAALHPPVDVLPFSDETLVAGPQIEDGKFIDADSTQEPYPIAWEMNKEVNDPRVKYMDDYKALKVHLQQEKLPLPAWAVEEKEDGGGGETTSGLSWSQSPRQMAAKKKEMEAQSRLKIEKERMQMQQMQEQQQKQLLLPASQEAVQQQQQKSSGKPKTVGPAADGDLLDAPPAPGHDEVFDEDGGGGAGTTGRRQLATGSVYRHGAPRTGERERRGGGGLLLRSGKLLAEPGYMPLSSGYFLPLQRDGTFGRNPLESQQQYEVLREKAKKGEIPEWAAYRGEDRLWMPLGEQVPPVEGVEDLKWRGAASRPLSTSTATTTTIGVQDDEKKKKLNKKEEEKRDFAALPKPLSLFGSNEPGEKQDNDDGGSRYLHILGGWSHHQQPSLAVKDVPINRMPGSGDIDNNKNNNGKRKQPYVSRSLAHNKTVANDNLRAWKAAQHTLSNTELCVAADIIREANTKRGTSGGGGEEEGDGTKKRRGGGGLNVWGGPPPVHIAAAIRGELMESFASNRGTGNISQRDVDNLMKKMINQSIKKLADQRRAQKKG